MTYSVEFHHPESLKSPFDNYIELIQETKKKVGKEQTLNMLDSIHYGWALNSGYYFKKIDDRHLFIHVSLNEKDFN